ncbi:MAG TPA: CDP-alcohol phosphatidyltransferase family protein [Thermotogota bacterium]|nr:CDP-alcohol phosphatidyltransferase family protein [Thermotogota bacterium]HPJ89992.1 CDP-alcohol phosphatidyltransferase family protein [Thermotogota bacterium]HPR97209.1 CDP-alcohol phosphatidyltransferase family protein [Thermotogota bacterium]
MKPIANYLSAGRILLSFGMLLTVPLSLMFFVLYFLCGLSDILDGYIARKTQTVSKLGARLDSIGDLTMVIILIFILYPILQITFLQLIWIIAIVIIRVISMLVVFVKFKTFAILHTLANKLTGLLLFAFLPLLLFIKSDLLIDFICLVGLVSAAEELLIHLTSDVLNLDRKSLFSK